MIVVVPQLCIILHVTNLYCGALYACSAKPDLPTSALELHHPLIQILYKHLSPSTLTITGQMKCEYMAMEVQRNCEQSTLKKTVCGKGSIYKCLMKWRLRGAPGSSSAGERLVQRGARKTCDLKAKWMPLGKSGYWQQNVPFNFFKVKVK